MHNPFREALLERRLTIGTWLQTSHPAVSEVLSSAGYGWLCVDCEHTEMGPEQVIAHARAMRGPVPLARVQSCDTLVIRRALDMGVMGVVVPLVDTPEQAAQAVSAAKYPPQGVRGFAYHRGNNWGVDFQTYAQQANDQIAVVVMIESRRAVENIDAILAVPGVDAVFVGPYDMSGSYGCTGDVNNPVIRNACQSVVKACRRAGKSAGLHVVIPTEQAITAALADGFNMLAVGTDLVFLRQSAVAAIQVTQAAHRAHTQNKPHMVTLQSSSV